MVFNQEMDGNGRISAVKCRPKVWISLQIQPRCPIPFQPHSAIVAPSTEFRLCTGQLQTPRDPLCESQGSRALRPASAMDVGKPIQLSRWKMWKEGECDGNWRSSCKISCGSANLPETGSSSMTMSTLGDWNSDVFQWKREGLFLHWSFHFFSINFRSMNTWVRRTSGRCLLCKNMRMLGLWVICQESFNIRDLELETIQNYPPICGYS